MAKTSYINIRIDPDIKAQAEQIYARLGITMTDAVNMFLHQSINFGGIPFELRIEQPNATTLLAMKEADEMARKKEGYDSTEEILRELKS